MVACHLSQLEVADSVRRFATYQQHSCRRRVVLSEELVDSFIPVIQCTNNRDREW